MNAEQPADWPGSFAELRNRCGLVTGGSTGIGAAVARALGQCGVNVAVHCGASRDAAEAVAEDVRASGAEAFVVQCDLARGNGEAAGLVDNVVERFGRLDILVNNAGSILGRVPTSELDMSLYRKIVDLNLTAVFTACQAAIPHFRCFGRGNIINTSSLAARMGGGPGTVAYAAAKAGVSTLTRGLARELAPDNIRVNAVAPGFIRTPLHDRHTAPEVLDRFVETIPMRRLGDPDDCVGAYLFLASERLSGYITGQIIEVNGGLYMP